MASASKKLSVTKEFLDSNLLLPFFPSNGKWDFQVANLLLATVNFELWTNHFSVRDSTKNVLRFTTVKEFNMYQLFESYNFQEIYSKYQLYDGIVSD